MKIPEDSFANAGYGLIRMKKEEETTQKEDSIPNDKIPPLLRNRPAILGAITDELDRFRKDVALRPPETTPESYDSVPIDDFGEAILRGMGWAPGVPIGKNSTECTKVFEIKRRPAGLGVGAKPKPEFYIGVKVRITGGEYRGKKARVLKLDKKDAIVILEFNNKQTTVLLKHMRKLRRQEEEDDPPLPSDSRKRKNDGDNNDKKKKKKKELNRFQ
jgi:ribosomal protein L24